MAYPFHPKTSFAEFKKVLKNDYNCEFIKGCQIHDEDSGNPYSIWYFKREMSGEQFICACEKYDDDDGISFHVIRSICKQLEIDYQKDRLFGLQLG